MPVMFPSTTWLSRSLASYRNKSYCHLAIEKGLDSETPAPFLLLLLIATSSRLLPFWALAFPSIKWVYMTFQVVKYLGTAYCGGSEPWIFKYLVLLPPTIGRFLRFVCLSQWRLLYVLHNAWHSRELKAETCPKSAINPDFRKTAAKPKEVGQALGCCQSWAFTSDPSLFPRHRLLHAGGKWAGVLKGVCWEAVEGRGSHEGATGRPHRKAVPRAPWVGDRALPPRSGLKG